MAVASTRIITITMAGDINVPSMTFPAASNPTAPGDIDVFSLLTGPNTITLPTGGSTPKGATIIPPPSNVQTISLKGVAGDTGIPLHKTDPTSISFDTPPPASFVLTVSLNIDGLRIVWT